MLHVGVDLHKRFSQVAILDEDGVMHERRIEHRGGQMEEFLGSLEAGSRVAVEATGNWHWFVDQAEAAGHQVVLSHPKQTKAIAHARLKNDRVDAERLASLLRAELLPTVWIPPRELRQAKELLRHRVLLRRIRLSVHNQLAALLRKRNLQPPARLGSQVGQAYLRQVELNPEADWIRRNGQALLAWLQERISELDQDFTRRVEADPVGRRLRTIPGVGVQTAYALVSVVGEIGRFPSAKHLASYVGLVPSVYQTGEILRYGRLTRQGSPLLRWLLVQDAWMAIRHHWYFGGIYERHRAKKIASRAIIPVVRALLRTIHAVWSKGKSYEEVFPAGEKGRVSSASV